MTNNQLTRERIELIANFHRAMTLPPSHDEIEELARMALAAMGSEPSRNPVLAYADSYRDMAKQGVESVPIWSVITDLERNIAPLYRHAQPAWETEREPIAWLNDAYLARGVVDGEAGSEDAGPGYIPVYREASPAQPAPVVPDEAQSRAIFEKWCSVNIERNKWHPEFYAHLPAREQWAAWEACRAAMLQELQKSAGESNNCRSRENVQDLLAGNCRENGNSSTKHFREISETSTNRSREHFISLCNEFWNWSEMDLVCSDDRGYELRMEWDGKVFKHPVTQALWRMYQAAPVNSPVIPEGYVMVPMRLTAENGAKGVLSGEFSETKFVNCPECFGDDECETCDGSGRIEITVPVTWTTIKEIWAKGVKHFAAAPQEVKGE